MDLREYERVKFELAEILRAAAIVLRESRPEIQSPFSDLYARLAEDRFNLVVVGRFSRGKSSLMNAMLHTESLPTGIVPLTSVITTVSYGSAERAYIEHEGWSIPEEIRLEALPQYVTQQGNPGNQKRVVVARVELPAELLRRGFHFVDTPGLGSAIIENTRTTERFLPQADAFMLVTSFDSPLSEEELKILRGTAGSTSHLFLVLNKRDTVSSEEQSQALRHLEEQAETVFHGNTPRIFSVSARDGIEATRTQDSALWAESGLPELVNALTTFLLTEKQERFLLRMCERVAEALRDVPNSRDRLAQLRAVRQRVELTQPQVSAAVVESVSEDRAIFTECPVCDRIEREMYDYLCQYQYDVGTRSEAQQKLAERSGLCAFHTWQYDAIASPHGTCLGFSPLLERVSSRMREAADASDKDRIVAELGTLQATSAGCELCNTHRDIERAGVTGFASTVTTGDGAASRRFSGLCLRHLELVVRSIDSIESIRAVIAQEARLLQLVSDDMRRYALKHDGVRRYMASGEELAAARRGLTIVAGHRNVGGLWRTG